jgi:hypothetical protein
MTSRVIVRLSSGIAAAKASSGVVALGMRGSVARLVEPMTDESQAVERVVRSIGTSCGRGPVYNGGSRATCEPRLTVSRRRSVLSALAGGAFLLLPIIYRTQIHAVKYDGEHLR